MNKKFPKKFISYSLVFIVFIIVFIFGKNLNPNPQDQVLQQAVDQPNRSNSRVYNISAEQTIYHINDVVNAKPQLGYRIMFDAEARGGEPTVNKNEETDSLEFDFYTTNSFQEEQLLKAYKIENNQILKNNEINFIANGSYEDLEIRKKSNNSKIILTFQNIRVYPLNTTNLSSLKSTILGSTGEEKVIIDNQVENTKDLYRFNWKNQIIGTSFIANSNNISSVEIGMSFIGNGGINNYYLELYEADDQGRPNLAKGRIAYFGFNQNSAEKELKLDKNKYRIPLTSNLEVGKKYFVGINNFEMKFNWLNTLVINGTKNNQKGIVWQSVKNKTKKLKGSLDIKMFSKDLTMLQGEKVLSNTVIQDLGNGEGIYTYNQTGNSLGFLDLFNIENENNIQSVFSDNVSEGISAKDSDKASFSYKFDTIYPFDKLSLEFQKISGGFAGIKGFYSFDNQNWKEIQSDYDKEEIVVGGESNFNQVFTGDGTQREIYLKIKCDPNGQSDHIVKLFGIKNLKVNAELKIK